MSTLPPQLEARGLHSGLVLGSSTAGLDPLLRAGDGAGAVCTPQASAAWLRGRSGCFIPFLGRSAGLKGFSA